MLLCPSSFEKGRPSGRIGIGRLAALSMPLVPMCGHVVAMFVAVWLLIAAAVPGVAAGGPLRARGGRLEFEFRTPLAGRRHAMPKIPGAAPDPAPHPPGLTVAEARAPVHSVVPAEGTARCDWRYEHARRSGVTNNFVLMQNMVQATWMFIVCAFPFAIQHPSLRYRCVLVEAVVYHEQFPSLTTPCPAPNHHPTPHTAQVYGRRLPHVCGGDDWCGTAGWGAATAAKFHFNHRRLA